MRRVGEMSKLLLIRRRRSPSIKFVIMLAEIPSGNFKRLWMKARLWTAPCPTCIACPNGNQFWNSIKIVLRLPAPDSNQRIKMKILLNFDGVLPRNDTKKNDHWPCHCSHYRLNDARANHQACICVCVRFRNYVQLRIPMCKIFKLMWIRVLHSNEGWMKKKQASSTDSNLWTEHTKRSTVGSPQTWNM